MAQIVLILDKPSQLVRGVARNALFEPWPNVFVGSLDRKRVSDLISVLETTKTNALLCAPSKSSALGVRFKVIGEPDRWRSIVEVDGLQFVRKPIKSNR